MNEMSRHSSLSLLLLLLITTAALALDDNRTSTAQAVRKIGDIAQTEKEEHFREKINRRMFNTILKTSKRHRLPTSNHLRHLVGNSGSDNTTHITRGNMTCLRVNCGINHYVRSCDFDGGNDTCVPCAQGTFLADITSSEQYNHECVSIPECFPEAIKSLEPYYCANRNLRYCKCDVTRNFCGVDPCKCEYGHCSYPTPVLRVNCGCERLQVATTTTKATTTTTMTTTTTVKQTTFMKSSKVVNVSSTPFHSSPPTTAEEPSLTTSTQPTITSGSEPEHTGLSGGVIAAIVIVVIILLVLVVAGIYFVWKKKIKGKTGNDGYTRASQAEDNNDAQDTRL